MTTPAMGVDKLMAVFDAAPVALLVFDRELVMVHANPAYLEAVGRPLEEIAGKRIFDVFPDDPANPGQARALRNVMNGAIERSLEPDQLRQRLSGLILRRRTMERPRETGYSALG